MKEKDLLKTNLKHRWDEYKDDLTWHPYHGSMPKKKIVRNQVSFIKHIEGQDEKEFLSYPHNFLIKMAETLKYYQAKPMISKIKVMAMVPKITIFIEELNKTFNDREDEYLSICIETLKITKLYLQGKTDECHNLHIYKESLLRLQALEDQYNLLDENVTKIKKAIN